MLGTNFSLPPPAEEDNVKEEKGNDHGSMDGGIISEDVFSQVNAVVDALVDPPIQLPPS